MFNKHWKHANYTMLKSSALNKKPLHIHMTDLKEEYQEKFKNIPNVMYIGDTEIPVSSSAFLKSFVLKTRGCIASKRGRKYKRRKLLLIK